MAIDDANIWLERRFEVHVDTTATSFEVYLQGSCAGCPSSTMTLKMGIEERLRQEMPEIREVVAL